MPKAETVICGAGIAGIASAYYLAVHYGQKNIVLIDRGQPMSWTTSKSGENFREYWPQNCMSQLMSRSIDLMEMLREQSDSGFRMDFSGYDFVSFQPDREIFPSDHLRNNFGAGRLLQISDEEQLRTQYHYLSGRVKQLVHIIRAGPMDVYTMGSLMLKLARQAGVSLHSAHINHLHGEPGNFRIETQHDHEVTVFSADKLLLTAGPMNNKLAGLLDVDLNVQSILQRKFVMPDPNGVIPEDMPYTIFSDPQYLDWNDDERELIADDPDYRWLQEEFPAGLHIKPQPGGQIKLGWAYNREPEEPLWKAADSFDFPNVVLRGASCFIPGLSAYVDQPPTPIHQFSGYYTRTPENWPLIGPLAGHDGLYTVAALSGFGTMAACAAGELIAQWMLDEDRPAYASHFHPDRYDNPEIRAEIDTVESDGQL